MLPPIPVRALGSDWEVRKLPVGQWVAYNLTFHPDQSDEDAARSPRAIREDLESRIELAVPKELGERLLRFFHPDNFTPEDYDPEEDAKLRCELIRLIEAALR